MSPRRGSRERRSSVTFRLTNPSSCASTIGYNLFRSPRRGPGARKKNLADDQTSRAMFTIFERAGGAWPWGWEKASLKDRLFLAHQSCDVVESKETTSWERLKTKPNFAENSVRKAPDLEGNGAHLASFGGNPHSESGHIVKARGPGTAPSGGEGAPEARGLFITYEIGRTGGGARSTDGRLSPGPTLPPRAPPAERAPAG